MDKTMEMVVVLMVLMIGAVVVISLMTGQTGGFDDFSNSTVSDAQCNLWASQYERKFCTDGQLSSSASSSELHSKLQDCENVQLGQIQCG